MTETINHATLMRLVEAQAVRGAVVIGVPGGWSIAVRYGMIEAFLAAKRGEVRTFRKFETVAAYLRVLGIVKFAVNAADFDPDAPKKSRRPDTAARLKKLHKLGQKPTT